MRLVQQLSGRMPYVGILAIRLTVALLVCAIVGRTRLIECLEFARSVGWIAAAYADEPATKHRHVGFGENIVVSCPAPEIQSDGFVLEGDHKGRGKRKLGSRNVHFWTDQYQDEAEGRLPEGRSLGDEKLEDSFNSFFGWAIALIGGGLFAAGCIVCIGASGGTILRCAFTIACALGCFLLCLLIVHLGMGIVYP